MANNKLYWTYVCLNAKVFKMHMIRKLPVHLQTNDEKKYTKYHTDLFLWNSFSYSVFISLSFLSVSVWPAMFLVQFYNCCIICFRFLPNQRTFHMRINSRNKQFPCNSWTWAKQQRKGGKRKRTEKERKKKRPQNNSFSW